MEQWYTFHTKPNAEYQVVNTLQRRGFQTYLPELEAPRSRQKRGKKPFFPCYLFVKLDFAIVDLAQVEWIPGLRRIVAFSDRPVGLTDEVIDLIRYKLGEVEASGGEPDYPFKPGDTVRIKEGPLRDMLAIFDGPATPRKRAKVLLSFLGQVSRVQVDLADLEEAPPDAAAPPPERPRRTRGRGRPIRGKPPAEADP